MRFIHYNVNGSYQDVYLYMGHIFIVTNENILKIYSLKDLGDKYFNRSVYEYPLLEYFLTRNKWLRFEVFTSAFRMKELNDKFISIVSEMSKETFDLSFKDLYCNNVNLDECGPFVLDINIYNNRVYLGSSSGWYHVDCEFSGNHLSHARDLYKRFDARTQHTTARYNAAHASCGDDGIATSLFEFWQPPFDFDKFSVIDTQSIKTSHMNYDLVNHRSSHSLEIYNSDCQKLNVKNIIYDHKSTELYTLTDIQKDVHGFGHIMDRPKTPIFDEDCRLESVVHIGKSLFMQYDDGTFVFKKIQYGKKRNLKSKGFWYWSGERDLILSVHKLGRGFLIETMGGVQYVEEPCYLEYEKEKPLIIQLTRKPSVSIRTYPQSIMYKNMITVIDEDGLHVFTAFDEEAFAYQAQYS